MTASAPEPSRFVLPSDAPYLANLEALWSADPELAAAIEAESAREPYPVEPSRAGPPTLTRPALDGRKIYLHSRYAPLEEAGRMVDTAGVDTCLAFYVFGFGLGYHVQNLFDRAGDEAIFLIFEPDVMMLRTAFEHHDFSKLISSGRALFFHRLDKGELLARLSPHTVLIHVGAANVVHAPSQQRFSSTARLPHRTSPATSAGMPHRPASPASTIATNPSPPSSSPLARACGKTSTCCRV
jgi:hypothetical protein